MKETDVIYYIFNRTEILRQTVLAFIIALLLTSCGQNLSTSSLITGTTSITEVNTLDTSTTQSPTTPFASFTPTYTLTPTAIAIPSLTATNTPIRPTLPYLPLPPGQYIVYQEGDVQGVTYHVLSKDGPVDTILTSGISGIGAFTRDGKFLADYHPRIEGSQMVIHNLIRDSTFRLQAGDGCHELCWSPQNDQLIAACEVNSTEIGLYLVNVAENSRTLVMPLGSLPVVWGLSWSSDGQWIAYGLWTGDANHPVEQGIYLLNTECFSDMATCSAFVKGPYAGDNISTYLTGVTLSWSPDSRYLTISYLNENAVYVLDMENNDVRELVSAHSLGWILGGVWSPDGEWLAYTSPPKEEAESWLGIYLLSPWGGDPVLVKTNVDYVVAWILIPHPFAPGDTYTITDAGADLNLRAEPSLDGEVLRKLQSGDIVTIVDGPVEADGYTWWQMQAEDGTAGWAVNIPEWYAPVSEEAMATSTP